MCNHNDSRAVENIMVYATDDVGEKTVLTEHDSCTQMSRGPIDIFVSGRPQTYVIIDRRSYPTRVFTRLATAIAHFEGLRCIHSIPT
jgi:hypothetical protein